MTGRQKTMIRAPEVLLNTVTKKTSKQREIKIYWNGKTKGRYLIYMNTKTVPAANADRNVFSLKSMIYLGYY